MNKAKNKLILYAVLVVFVLLTVLLGIINGISFTMAARDADVITQMLSEQRGTFDPQLTGSPNLGQRQSNTGLFGRGEPGNMGPMGPDSPETAASVRYFTYAFSSPDSPGEKVAFAISSVTENEAAEWARSLLQEGTGWTRGTYRYRVYTYGEKIYVTVIDQGRELLSAYRILIISAVGELVALALMFLFLRYAGKRLFTPLEDADRKQKKFIAGIENEFKIPLAVVSADTELLERSGGANDQTGSIRRQVKQMSELLKRLGSLAVFSDETEFHSRIPLSEYYLGEIDACMEKLSERSLEVKIEIEPDIYITADPEAVKRLVSEIVDNALRYALTWVEFSLTPENGHVILLCENDTNLPSGPCDQVFDRFTTLANAGGEHALGLGLSAVKDIVQLYNGRAKAYVSNGVFTLRIVF